MLQSIDPNNLRTGYHIYLRLAVYIILIGQKYTWTNLLKGVAHEQA